MIELHPEILEKDGKKQFVILPYEEFAAIQEALADADPDRAASREERGTRRARNYAGKSYRGAGAIRLDIFSRTPPWPKSKSMVRSRSRLSRRD